MSSTAEATPSQVNGNETMTECVTFNSLMCVCCAIYNDVTEQKQLSERLRQAQKMEAIGLRDNF